MNAYTPQQWANLKALYVEAAIDIVVNQGWAMLSVRNVGGKVGRTGTAIQRIFPNIALKQAVIEAAFDELLTALLPYTEAASPPPADIHRTILAYLRREHSVPALVLQVLAQFGASGGSDGLTIAQSVANARAAAIAQLDRVLKSVRGMGRYDAQRLMCWYVATCCLMATDSPSDAELLEMAGPAA